MYSFLHQASFDMEYWCYDRFRLVRLEIVIFHDWSDRANQVEFYQVIYNYAQLFRC
ncbi:hypothetical protein EGH67_14670 [Klebsiella aerogenes]|uniref:Uncharacterized protein n=1 Tax=Klebsiella aerogenes (strain ATCC 13048 / DSM 30053 / CCUG 1429 / JCM 1235 / KCTC 2190 / NBRC 13534 / NCIMB 10102 / NCTC 10006 / CDC 819-56) TaxID=1028307 RepID=A0A0H3FUN9_KLEAK|nr:hypothetical protein EAE_23130 [Klebsiella aerogenes KCTC 2190]MBK1473248.1 hypothetical protein [Klebsiella aerogenes]QEU17698.1 hypothetical protein FOB49_03245 [Klebsiella aerogenes]QGT20749.1 hypothetical protein GIY02_21065 [Klebsiella aerogenes]QGT25557.1 hypothetical protein GIY01_21035 [Klebsiella aerogenes]